MSAHALYLFPEAPDRLIAMEERRGSTSAFLQLIDPEFEAKPHLEQGAAPEQIAPLKPDAIIIKSYLADQLGAPLEELGLKIVYVDLETPEQYFRDLAAIGEMLGNAERAAEIEAFYRERTDRVVERVADVAQEPRVLVIQNSSVGEELAFEVPPANWMQTLQVRSAGGRPVWTGVAESGGWTVVNFEQIAAWDPDIIFVIAFRADPESLVEELEEDPKWGALRAVQEGKLYGFPIDFYGWEVPDPRWILGLSWVATKIHPEVFSDVDMIEEVNTFYEQMYGMDREAIDEHILSVLEGDL